MDTQTNKLAVDIREAAAMLSVSPRTIQNYLHAKVLPGRKIGRRTVITIRALEAFLRADRQLPAQEERRAANQPKDGSGR
ncbi:MAG TPA: helix-turn-helix domain-containing protein [Terriglobia bacterium]|nr:helix-turn-helix domain-containing protein [Terriglobia bacterium]